MKPHYLDHTKGQQGKLWNSNRAVRQSNYSEKGQGRKPRRPKGSDKIATLWTLLPGIGAMVWVWD